MNGPERVPAEKHKPLTAYVWDAIAVLTCPCHRPIFAVVLTGTTAGAVLGEYRDIAIAALIGLFILSVANDALVGPCTNMIRHEKPEK